MKNVKIRSSDNIPEFDAGKFVATVIARSGNDNRFKAVLRRAANGESPDALGVLAGLGVNLKNPDDVLACSLVASCIVKDGIEYDGELDLGSALLQCAGNVDKENLENGTNPCSYRIRRILACNSVSELCSVLLRVLPFIAEKSGNLSYSKLLRAILKFGGCADEIRRKKGIDHVRRIWASGFWTRVFDKSPVDVVS